MDALSHLQCQARVRCHFGVVGLCRTVIRDRRQVKNQQLFNGGVTLVVDQLVAASILATINDWCTCRWSALSGAGQLLDM
jgi:hypothetical protein